MTALAVLLALLTLSILVVRIATVALMQTGMSREMAEFQARSAFTGTGFTTSESESIVEQPVRRRIIKSMMLMRGAGITVAISTLILSFVGADTEQRLVRFAYLSAGCLCLWLLARSRRVDELLTRWIRRWLSRVSDMQIADYAQILRLSENYEVSELIVENHKWLANQTLKELNLFEEGVMVLGVHRSNGDYIGAPRGNVTIKPGDTLVVYGRSKGLRDLDKRKRGREGDEAHKDAVWQQEQVEEEESAK